MAKVRHKTKSQQRIGRCVVALSLGGLIAAAGCSTDSTIAAEELVVGGSVSPQPAASTPGPPVASPTPPRTAPTDGETGPPATAVVTEPAVVATEIPQPTAVPTQPTAVPTQPTAVPTQPPPTESPQRPQVADVEELPNAEAPPGATERTQQLELTIGPFRREPWVGQTLSVVIGDPTQPLKIGRTSKSTGLLATVDLVRPGSVCQHINSQLIFQPDAPVNTPCTMIIRAKETEDFDEGFVTLVFRIDASATGN